MDDTPVKGETVPTVTPKNEPPVPPTPPVEEKKTEDAEVERLRKEKEQAEMRANQLQNQLKAKEDAEAQAQAKQLEEQNEFKILYEQEKAKNDETARLNAEEERKKELSEAENNVLSDYSDEVKAEAKDFGFNLSDVSEAAIADLKAKLDKINTRISNSASVGPNNPGSPSQSKEYSREELAVILNDPVKRDAYYRAKGGAAELMMDSPR